MKVRIALNTRFARESQRRWTEIRRKRMGIEWYCAVVVQNERGPGSKEARVPTPRPERTKHVCSAVFTRGYRHYAFDSPAQRDAFVGTWPTAHACDDPIP